MNKGFAMFEKRGLMFPDEMQQVFEDTTSTGSLRFSPNSGYLSSEEEEIEFSHASHRYNKPVLSTSSTVREHTDTHSTTSSPPKNPTKSDSGSLGKRSRGSLPTPDSRKKTTTELHQEDNETFNDLVSVVAKGFGSTTVSEKVERVPDRVLEKMYVKKEFEALLAAVQNLHGVDEDMVLFASEYFMHNEEARMMFMSLNDEYRFPYRRRAYNRANGE